MLQFDAGSEVYKFMVEAVPNALILVNHKAEIVYLNRFAEKLFGYSIGELEGKSIQLLIPDRYQNRHLIFMHVFLKSPETRAMGEGRDLFALKKDKTEFPAEIGLSSVTIDNYQYVLVMITDITQRMNFENALEKERLRLRGIIEGTNAGTWEWNMQTGAFRINEKWAEMLGYTLDELSPMTVDKRTKYLYNDDVQKSRELLNKHISGESDSYECDYRMKHKNGSQVWVLERGKLISRTPDGKPLMVMGTQQDITYRKLAQVEFETILSTTLDGFFIINETGEIIEVNDAFCNMLGYSRKELLSMSVPDIEAVESSDDVRQHIDKILAEGYDRFETIHQRKDKSLIDIEISVTLIDIAVIKLIVFARDISERKRVEKIIERSKESLLQAQKIGNVGHWEYVHATGKLLWSDQTYHIYEKKSETFNLSFDSVTAMFHDDDRQAVVEAYRKSVIDKSVLEVSHRIVTGTGKLRHVVQRGKNRYDEQANYIGTMGTVQDITKLKRHENEILNRNKQLAELSKELKTINTKLAKRNDDLNRSIKYAQKIQHSILPEFKEMKESFSRFHLFFKPKSVIGGDFYRFYKNNGKLFLAVVDCTGHSVPGAMMSMIVNSLLNEIIIQRGVSATDTILSDLHHELYMYLNQQKGDDYSQDGCDISLCKIDTKRKTLQFSGAQQDLYIYQNNRIKKIKATKKSIGGLSLKGDAEPVRFFESNTIELTDETMIAMTTDGILDQLNDDDNVFGEKMLSRMLLQAYLLPEEKQAQNFINKTINDWLQNVKQQDDMLLVTYKINT